MAAIKTQSSVSFLYWNILIRAINLKLSAKVAVPAIVE